MAPGTMGSVKSGDGKVNEGRRKCTERGDPQCCKVGAGEEEEPKRSSRGVAGNCLSECYRGNETKIEMGAVPVCVPSLSEHNARGLRGCKERVCEVKIVTTKKLKDDDEQRERSENWTEIQ